MAEKIYAGKGKEYGSYGAVMMALDVEVLLQHAYEYNGKRYVKLSVQKMREPDRYGKTHTVTIDTWQPERKKEEREDAKQRIEASDGEIPF